MLIRMVHYFKTIGEQICDLCNRYITHDVSTEEKHFSCVCYILDHYSICCKAGFENLIKVEPELKAFIKTVPFMYTLNKILYISFCEPLNNPEKNDIIKHCTIVLNDK